MGQDLYENCQLCPNLCGVDRTSGKTGRCNESSSVRIAWAGLHKGEEPPVSGANGSGMVFFCGCPLHCAYCQNYQISSAGGAGFTVSVSELASIFKELQNFGATTLNLVTGTHFVPSIIQALELAKKDGFSLPVVWNSSGYETVQTLRLIDPYIDLYLLDAKTLDKEVGRVFCGLASYADAIVPVMQFLKRRHPVTELEKLKGVLVRHLVFPGTLDSTFSFLKWFADNYAQNFRLSLMVQFVPPRANPGFKSMTRDEYFKLTDYLESLDIDGFVQEQDDNEILWIPDFNRDNPFPDGFAKVLPLFLEFKRMRGL